MKRNIKETSSKKESTKKVEYERKNKLDETAKDSEDINEAIEELSYKLQKQNDEKEATIITLRMEIDNLKRKVADQEETIDDLVEERDEGLDEVYKLKLKLADAWNIKFETDAEKVREVARLVRENKVNKSYCAAAKEAIANMGIKKNGISIDSGIDVQSLEKLIDERVTVTIDAKFEKHIKNKNDAVSENDELTKSIYTKKAEIINHEITPITISDGRELNLIVHGLEENGTNTQTNTIVKELFDTLEVKHHPTTLTDRLGGKSPDKIRPIRLKMESNERKSEIMSKLWKLKHGPARFQKISITEDFTQEERKEIKRWVDEAKERTKQEDGYIWKIRGSPRSKLRFIKLSV